MTHNAPTFPGGTDTYHVNLGPCQRTISKKERCALALTDKHMTGSRACKIKLCGRIMAIHLWNNEALRANKLVFCNPSIFATLLWRQNLH